jgi:WD40 repeat protein
MSTVEMTTQIPEEKNEDILNLCFNQDTSCFAYSGNNGFTVYSCDPFRQSIKRIFNGGIGIVSMLFRCNIMAIVGGGKNPEYSPNKVMVWDDHSQQSIGELVFRTPVKCVKLRRESIIIVLEHRTYIYNFSDLKLRNVIHTMSNPKGLVSISIVSNANVIATLGMEKGTIRIENYELNKTHIINAHESEIGFMNLTDNGKYLATTSIVGTIIRIWDTYSGEKIQELRRGTERAIIYSLAFSKNNQFLACSSDSETIHIFKLQNDNKNYNEISNFPEQENKKNKVKNLKSSLSLFKGYLPTYFSSEWSFIQYKINYPKSFVAFDKNDNKLLVITNNGHFYKLNIVFENGSCSCKKEENYVFL